MTSNIFSQDKTSTKTIVQTAINLASAYHEVQLKSYLDILEGYNQEELVNLINKYHCLQEVSETSEEAFVAFLQYLGKAN